MNYGHIIARLVKVGMNEVEGQMRKKRIENDEAGKGIENMVNGNKFLNEKKFQEAIQCYNIAIENFESSGERINNKQKAIAYVSKGIALFELMEYVESLKCFDKALSLDQHNENACMYKEKVIKEMEQKFGVVQIVKTPR